jgi:hypothetical protein
MHTPLLVSVASGKCIKASKFHNRSILQFRFFRWLFNDAFIIEIVLDINAFQVMTVPLITIWQQTNINKKQVLEKYVFGSQIHSYFSCTLTAI